MHIRPGANHPAANIKAHGAHRYRAVFAVCQYHTAYRHTVAIVSIGRDDHEPRTGEACCIDDLAIEYTFGFLEQPRSEKEPHRDVPHVFRLKLVIAIAMPTR